MTSASVRSTQPGRTILQVEGLETHFIAGAGTVRAIDNVDLRVHAREIVGIVGESGSGKTVLGLSIPGLVDPPGRIVGGRILFDGVDLVGRSETELRQVRGRSISMVFQDPSSTLSPTLRIGKQMMNVVRAHRNVPRREALMICRDALGRLGIPSPEERLDAYPHQLSGGMRQRVCIAMAMLNRPALIIADEPTTALDVTTQAQIIDEVRKLREDTGTAFIWVTHDLAVIADLADRVGVMYAGQIVEQGPVEAILAAPRHPYTWGLLNCIPSNNVAAKRLPHIPGLAPSPGCAEPGCKFRPRCSRASGRCGTAPALMRDDAEHETRCFHPVIEARPQSVEIAS